MYYDALRSRVRRATAARKKQRAAQELIQQIDIFQHIAPVYADLHRDIEAAAHTVYNLPGGRGSGKSSFVALEIVNAIMRDPTGQSNAIVFRRYANTMRESVFSQITWAIDALGVSELWRSRLSPMGFISHFGCQTIYRHSEIGIAAEQAYIIAGWYMCQVRKIIFMHVIIMTHR